jgi:hypothetical protein
MNSVLAKRFARLRLPFAPRVWVALGLSLALWGLLVLLCPLASGLMLHAVAIGLAAVSAFSLAEHYPATLPTRLPRWMAQVAATALAIPLAAVVVFALSPSAGEPAFWQDGHLRGCFIGMNAFGLLVAPWVALGALVRQREAFAREQALAFDLERSELARQALDARMHLLQAQVAPHFLFNTLANVQALVDADRRRHPPCCARWSPTCARACRACTRRRRAWAANSISLRPISTSCTCACPTGSTTHCTSTNGRARCRARRSCC